MERLPEWEPGLPVMRERIVCGGGCAQFLACEDRRIVQMRHAAVSMGEVERALDAAGFLLMEQRHGFKDIPAGTVEEGSGGQMTVKTLRGGQVRAVSIAAGAVPEPLEALWARLRGECMKAPPPPGVETRATLLSLNPVRTDRGRRFLEDGLVHSLSEDEARGGVVRRALASPCRVVAAEQDGARAADALGRSVGGVRYPFVERAGIVYEVETWESLLAPGACRPEGAPAVESENREQQGAERP